MSRNFIALVTIVLISTLCVSLLLNYTVLLSIILIFIAYGKHRIYPISKELLWFVLIFIGSAFIEIFLVNFTKAWSYVTPYLFGVPIWAPLFWGILVTAVIGMYEGLTDNR